MSDIDTINKMRDDFVSAFNAGDSVTVIGFLADDAIGMPPDVPAQVGKEIYGAFVEELMRTHDVNESVTALETVIAGDWAYDRGHWEATVKNKADGAQSEVGGDYLWILRKSTDGEWCITRLIWNNDNPPA